MPRQPNQIPGSQVLMLQALLNRLPPRWRKPALWAGAALALAAAGWLLPAAAPASGAAGGGIGGALETAGLVASVTLKLGFVLLLAYACLWLLRRWQGAPGRAQQRRLELLETLRFSPRQALHVVRAGDQVLLIGATDQALSVLTEVHEELAASPAPAPNTSVSGASASGFGQLLSRLSLPLGVQPIPQPVEVEASRGQHER